METVATLGTGIMGLAMARRLTQRGFTVRTGHGREDIAAGELL